MIALFFLSNFRHRLASRSGGEGAHGTHFRTLDLPFRQYQSGTDAARARALVLSPIRILMMAIMEHAADRVLNGRSKFVGAGTTYCWRASPSAWACHSHGSCSNWGR